MIAHTVFWKNILEGGMGLAKGSTVHLPGWTVPSRNVGIFANTCRQIQYRSNVGISIDRTIPPTDHYSDKVIYHSKKPHLLFQ